MESRAVDPDQGTNVIVFVNFPLRWAPGPARVALLAAWVGAGQHGTAPRDSTGQYGTVRDSPAGHYGTAPILTFTH